MVHPRRGRRAIEAMGILPRFAGVAVHAWAPYHTYTAPDHQLCCAHALRELQAVTDAAPQGQWCWATQAAEALIGMQQLVSEAISQERTDEMVTYEHSLHEGYDGLNQLERDFAAALDRLGSPWCRNPSRSGYGIPQAIRMLAAGAGISTPRRTIRAMLAWAGSRSPEISTPCSRDPGGICAWSRPACSASSGAASTSISSGSAGAVTRSRRAAHGRVVPCSKVLITTTMNVSGREHRAGQQRFPAPEVQQPAGGHGDDQDAHRHPGRGQAQRGRSRGARVRPASPQAALGQDQYQRAEPQGLRQAGVAGTAPRPPAHPGPGRGRGKPAGPAGRSRGRTGPPQPPRAPPRRR